MQTNRNLTVITFLIAFILQSCIYEYLSKTGEYEKYLVVYGMITTENGPHEITIYKNRQIGEISFDSVSHAIVSLIDDAGNIIPLTEASNGRYLTPETFAGQIGTKYKLSFVMPDGKQYESDFVEMLDVPGISDIKAEHIIKPATLTTAEDEGYQFYISTEPGSSGQKYFKWEINEDWEFDMPYVYDYYWDGNDLIDISIPYQCYSQRHLRDFFISTTTNSQINYISNYPLHFVSKYYKLKYGYGIRVRQYALSEFSYNFWENVIENDNPNALNTKQQYPLIGNIKCISNPNEPVYGILEASAVKIKNLQVKTLYVNPQIPDCGVTKMVKSLDPQSLILEPPAMIEAQPPPQWGAGFLLVRDPKCIYCEASDGTTIRPEYWGENK
jgi:hypothetical protein